MSTDSLTLFIVDDEAATRMTLGFPFEGSGYRIVEFDSGEACLAGLDQKPDIILLDIEMPGMDGIATCQALREAGEHHAHVIFVSVHNDLETRLKAYDAGGSDYLIKPVAPDELAQKVAIAKQLLEQRHGLTKQVELASKTAFTAMSSMGELGIVLQFLRASFGCETQECLAARLLDALAGYELGGLVELHSPGQRYCASSQGPCSQLEMSILGHAHGMDRMFQFRDRLVVNYPNITLLASGLPIGDADRLGRLRDHLVTLAEGANARLVALASETARRVQAGGIVQALTDLSAVTELIERQQGDNRLRALDAINQHVQDMERAFVHLSLNQAQENALGEMARGTAERVGALLGESKEVSDGLHRVTMRLRQLVAKT